MKELTLKFNNDEDLSDFTAWLLDGGGEDSLAQYCEIREEGFLASI